MTELIITELNERRTGSSTIKVDQGCQTRPMCNKSTETEEENFIIARVQGERKKNYFENRLLRNYYKNRNQKTDILNTIISSESQRETLKKNIIEEFKNENDLTPKWVINIK
jgi:hypothetical protein